MPDDSGLGVISSDTSDPIERITQLLIQLMVLLVVAYALVQIVLVMLF